MNDFNLSGGANAGQDELPGGTGAVPDKAKGVVAPCATTLTFTIPADLWLSANQRMHWAPKSKATKRLRAAGLVQSKVAGLRGLGPCHVAAFIGYPTNGKADPANAAPTVKALIDGMVDAGVWPDDDSTYVIGPTYLRDPKTGTKGVHTVRLVLTPQEIPWT